MTDGSDLQPAEGEAKTTMYRPGAEGGLEAAAPETRDYRDQLRSRRWKAAPLENPEVEPTDPRIAAGALLALAALTLIVLVIGYSSGLWSLPAQVSPSANAPRHVVWDWNGTLFDDFELTALIAERTFATLGLPGVSGDDIRAHFRRPFSDFYASLFGRPVSADEFAFIRERYEIEYERDLYAVTLRADAGAAMDLIAPLASQSLLSMAPTVHL